MAVVILAGEITADSLMIILINGKLLRDLDNVKHCQDLSHAKEK